jgi:hypothetical protein
LKAGIPTQNLLLAMASAKRTGYEKKVYFHKLLKL